MTSLYLAEGLSADDRGLAGHVAAIGDTDVPDEDLDQILVLYALSVHPEWGGGVVAAVDCDGRVVDAVAIPVPDWVRG